MSTFAFGQSALLDSIRQRLRAILGPERESFGLTPIQQFIRSYIGYQTHDLVSWNAFRRLWNRYPDAEALADAPEAEIEALLEGVTYADKKAKELKRALLHIRARAGSVDINFLSTLDEETALFWLEQIHGVGRKIAAATLNFSTLRKRSFVADMHVIRVMERFGFVRKNADAKDVYDAVMQAAETLSAEDLYELHWHLKKLGQRLCRPFRPACDSCPLSDICMKRPDCAPALYFA